MENNEESNRRKTEASTNTIRVLVITACAWAGLLLALAFIFHPDAYQIQTNVTATSIVTTGVQNSNVISSNGGASGIYNEGKASPVYSSAPPKSKTSSQGFDPLLEVLAVVQAILCVPIAAILLMPNLGVSRRLWKLAMVLSICLLLEMLAGTVMILDPIIAAPVGILLVMACIKSNPKSVRQYPPPNYD